jgi:hypothetical protein
MVVDPVGFAVWFGIASLGYLGGLAGIVSKLHRIARALEEANKLRSRQTPP